MVEDNNIKIVNIEDIDSETYTFLDGSKRSITRFSSVIVGRGIYNPGWRWSLHAGAQTGKKSVRHIGWIESGRMMICTKDNIEKEVSSGDFFEVGPDHDAWVLGDEPCVALDVESTPAELA